MNRIIEYFFNENRRNLYTKSGCIPTGIPQEFLKTSIGLCTVYNDNEIYLGKQMTSPF